MYNHVLSTGKIGTLTLKNRIVMPGMSTNFAGPNGEVTDRIIKYYEERAEGGVGLIITEFTTIDHELGKGAPNQLRIDHDNFIPELQRLTNAIHKHGAKLFVQLHHAGRQSNSLLTGGKQIVGPSPVMIKAVGEEPRELTTEEVKDLVQKFIQGAVRSKHAGADGVEIHAAHGYLINNFLSPNANVRKDEYGGSFENRIRFLEEIVVGVKEQCGADYPVIVRLSVDEFDEGGTDVALSKKIAKHLESLGVDGLHASAGNYNSMETVIESPVFEQGWRVYLAEELKKEVDIPVIAVGNIRQPKYVESIIADGKADFVAIGRGHIADPEWVRKVSEGREAEIRMCISCLHCVYSKEYIECSVNARAGRELEFPHFEKVDEPRHVVIVGGGPGGMEAARVLTEKGYSVTLFEKNDQLGGQLKLVTEPVYRKKTKWYVEYMKNELNRLRVDVRLNTEATLAEIQSLNPYAILLATGSQPFTPEIEGVDLPNVCHYIDVKKEKKVLNDQRVAVLGSGMVCYSTSKGLAEKGNTVTYVELPTKSGSKISGATRLRLFEKLKKLGVHIITDHKVEKIQETGVLLEDTQTSGQKKVEVDQVVVAMGVTAYNPLEEMLKAHFEHVFVIGDAAGHATLADATRGGFETAYRIEALAK
ncbi:FAD-dependent oxidoreductase [Niallia sp. Krafla_26]|uniref:oxidoreductase n=1 Tax=Niallia sp. Krafla_26 TaxID=3064703 RepID=UPI003D17BBA4